MPPTGLNETRLDHIQAAIEATRGTALAATRKTTAKGSATWTRPLVSLSLPNGTYSPNAIVTKGRGAGTASITDVASFEDLPFWLEGALKGGVTPTADSGTPTPAQTWTFTPSPATDDLASYTLEFGDPGNAYQAKQFMFDSFTLRGDPDNANEPSWMIEGNGPVISFEPHAFTGSLTDRTIEPIPALGTTLYLDDAGATIGTTPLLGQFINWSITGTNNVHTKAFAEDVNGPAAGRVGRGDRTFSIQVVLEFDNDAEFAFYRDNALVQRLIRIESAGSVIHTSTPDVTNLLQIDAAGYWSTYSTGDRDGNKTITLTLMTVPDPVLGFEFKATVVNDVASL